MWLSAIKLASLREVRFTLTKQKTKMAMSDAQLMHAERMARGEEALPGKTVRSSTIRLERRGRFDSVSVPVLVLDWAVISDDPTAWTK